METYPQSAITVLWCGAQEYAGWTAEQAIDIHKAVMSACHKRRVDGCEIIHWPDCSVDFWRANGPSLVAVHVEGYGVAASITATTYLEVNDRLRDRGRPCISADAWQTAWAMRDKVANIIEEMEGF